MFTVRRFSLHTTQSRLIAAAFAVAVASMAAGALVRAQAPAASAPAQAPPAPAPAGRGGAVPAYPARPAGDPVQLERGKVLYGVNCALCHGTDARGAQGPSLIRSEILLKDQNGETLAQVVRPGRPERGMPPFALSNAEIADIAAFIHAFPVSSRDAARMRPATIVVGDAKAGTAVFARKCAACHSVSGDLQGFGTKFTDPRQLQTTWLMPPTGGGRGSVTNVKPATVTVTMANGEKVEGVLRRIDDFIVTVGLPDGQQRSIRRTGDVPKVEIHDPIKPHRELLETYTDKEIHDLTAYLVTVK